jgi:hypothetical protein
MDIDTPVPGPPKDLLLAYGSVMSEWAYVEAMLALWFRWLIQMEDHEMSNAIFYSARSFQGRAEMLQAAIEHSNQPDEEISWVADLLAKALSYNSCRNELAHGFFNWMRTDCEPAITPGKYWWRDGGVTVRQLETARDNFRRLRRLAHQTLEDQKLIPVGRTKLVSLPNEPYSNEPSRKQKGRLRQLQAALRKHPQPKEG